MWNAQFLKCIRSFAESKEYIFCKSTTGKPVVFVYVTNESSPSATWVRETESMPGIHYRLPDTMWREIKELGGGGIPHYLIFDHKGNKVLDNTGYSTGLYKEFFEEIDKLLKI